MDRHLHRAAFWAAVFVLLVSTLATVSAAPSPAATTYKLTGYVDQPGGVSAAPVPAGVAVDLVSAATGTTYKAVTGVGGVFTFSSTSSSTLAPGYWKLQVPTETNTSISGCGKCAVLPQDQNPTFAYYSYSDLTSKTFAVTIPGVLVVPYNATQNGTVYQGVSPVSGVTVDLLDPAYNGLVLSNTTTNASGEFTLKAPYGHWILQSVHRSGKDTFTNSTAVTIAATKPALVNPVLYAFTVSGWINTTAGRIPATGNATLYDPTNGYIYSVATPPGGYYSLATYPAGFSHGAQTFDVILSANGYETTYYPLTVSTPGAIQRNVVVGTISESSMGVYTTHLNFTNISTLTGKGNVTISTRAVLGNDSVVPFLPNATVGQLWAQLGLDYNHSLSFPESLAAQVESYFNSRGPFFLPGQAGLEVNETSFVNFKTAQTLAPGAFASTCAVACGLTSSAHLEYNWSHTYALNGTVGKNSSSYTISFTFLHPASSSLVYNYSVTLPSGYVLQAHTTAPTRTTLTPTGPQGTWGSFTLSSLASTTPSASAKFSIVKSGSVSPIVNVTSKNFTFSSANVLNDSNYKDNYTVVLGLHENATFSAANSVYASSTNGSLFTWNFGDGSPAVSTTNETTNHTYLVTTPTANFPKAGFYNGSLKITTSSGVTNTTYFHVWVVASSPKAAIASNATTWEMRKTTGGAPYIELNLSANTSTIAFHSVSTAPAPNNISIAYFEVAATKTVHKIANFTVSSGGNVSANWSVDFNPPTTIGTGHYIKNGIVDGTTVPFFGWEYNLTLTVWSVTGTKASTTLPILLIDTQAPTPSFTVLNGAGKAVTGSAVTEGANGKAKIELDAAASADPNNGTIVAYDWHITNGNNSTLALPWDNVSTVKPYPTFDLAPETHPYTINLTVEDEAGNFANKTMSLTVSPNATLRPVLTASNLTGPTTLTEGKSVTFWVNVTVTGGTHSTAKFVNVTWYFLSPSGTGAKRYVSGTPSSTVFYTYTSGTPNTKTPIAAPYTAGLAYNHTIRAEVTFTPHFTGSFVLYANATASNEYVPDYHGGANLQSISVSIKASTTTELVEYGGIALVVVVAIVFLVWWTRRPSRKAGAKSTGRAGLERGSKKPDTDTKDDDA